MFCRDCKFHHSGYMYNSCGLTNAEYYLECIKEPCSIIDDNYIFIQDCPPLGFVKGGSAIKFMKGGVGG